MSEESTKPKTPVARIMAERPRRSSISGSESPVMKKENEKKKDGVDVKRVLDDTRYCLKMKCSSLLNYFSLRHEIE
jgi:hypothetical protein